MGSSVATWLADPNVVEVMLNPDGRLWVDRLSEGLTDTWRASVRRRWGAHRPSRRASCRRRGSFRFAACLGRAPETGERFESLIPPLVAAPAFAIRKPAVAVFMLDDFVAAGIMTVEQAAILREAVVRRRNVMVAGGTSGPFKEFFR